MDMMKHEVSNILSDTTRNWQEVDKVEPPVNQEILIRIEDRSKVYYEDEDNIIYAEDIKIAKVLINVDQDHKGKEFSIIPPFPLYDYSPLTHYDKVKEDATVTHWAPLEEGDMESWNERFDPPKQFQDLGIIVSQDQEENVYRALLWAGRYIALNAGKDFEKDADGKLREMYDVVCGLQAIMDRKTRFINGKEIKVSELKKQKEKIGEVVQEVPKNPHELADMIVNQFQDPDKRIKYINAVQSQVLYKSQSWED